MSHIKKNMKSVNMKFLANNILCGNYRDYAVQTPLARQMVLTLQKNAENIVNVKPLLWGKKIESREKNNSKFTIVHAGTPKFRHQRRLIYETSDEYVMALSEICNSVKKYSELQLIIKTRPLDYELTEKSLLELLSPLPDNVIRIGTSFHSEEAIAG